MLNYKESGFCCVQLVKDEPKKPRIFTLSLNSFCEANS